MQKRAFLFLLLVAMEIMIWISLVSARSLPQANLAVAAATKELGEDNVKKLSFVTKKIVDSESWRGLDHGHLIVSTKCGGCEPCMAIQVPTTTYELKPLYSNYEPEGWKCKCGSTFYNP